MTFWNIFLIFPRKLDLTFHAYCLHNFLIFPRNQVFTSHADCVQWRHFTWNVKSCFLRKIRKKYLFSGKNKKNITNLLFAELAQRVVKAKALIITTADDTLKYFFYYSQKIRHNISYELSALADKMSSLIFSEKWQYQFLNVVCYKIV